MKKILVLTTSLSSGGITSFTINLVNELANKHDVSLLYTTDTDNKVKLIDRRVRLISFSYPKRFPTLLYIIRRNWIKYVVKLRYRNHSKVSPMSSIQRIAYSQAQLVSFPKNITNTIYDIGISTAEFFCNDALVLHINSEKKIGWIHPDYKVLNTDIRFDKEVLGQLDYIATVSRSTRKTMIECIPEYATKIIYVPNLINSIIIKQKARALPSEYNIRNREHIIVTVCRIDNSSKRLDRIIQVAKKLISKSEQFHWFIVGDGPDYQTVSELIATNELSDYVHLIGNRSNPYPFIRHADLFVLLSQYEGKPIVIDEAIVLGCPIITTRYTSAEEQVTAERGIIIDNDDNTIVEDFYAALNWDQIDRIREKLKNNNYGESVKNTFNERINLILGE